MSLALNCPFCNTPLTKKKYCDGCGEDVVLYKKAVATSNAYYNSGLNKARVRDLSGAVADLNKSIKFNKNNIQARNLLGLVYYEMGEVVDALSQWVISKNLMPKKNELADAYINDLQSNPTKLENYNQAIKKYNSALLSAKQDSEDLAIIQLKKVINLNPRFIRAMHLLALLYIKTGEKERAHRVLVKAAKIDIANTTTLRYLSELGYKSDGPDTGTVSYTNGEQSSPAFIAGDIYKDDKPNVMAFVNLIIGVVIGLALAFFLIVPAVKKDAASEYASDSVKNSDAIAEKNNQISTLETTNKTLQDKIDSLNKQLEKANKDTNNAASIADMYADLFAAVNYYLQDDKEKAVSFLSKIDESKYENTDAKAIYESLKEEIYSDVVNDLYDQGHTKYSNGHYEESLEILKTAYGYDKTNVDVIYFMARSYERLGDTENAKKYYQQIIDNYSDNKRATEATQRLRNIQ